MQNTQKCFRNHTIYTSSVKKNVNFHFVSIWVINETWDCFVFFSLWIIMFLKLIEIIVLRNIKALHHPLNIEFTHFLFERFEKKNCLKRFIFIFIFILNQNFSQNKSILHLFFAILSWIRLEFKCYLTVHIVIINKCII